MTRGVGLALLAATLAACAPPPPARPEKVGTTAVDLFDAARQRPVPVQLWYPAAADAVETPQAYEHAFRGHAAVDAPYRAAGPRPLVLLSHGDGGGRLNLSWIAEILAGHGYIVATPEHWGNTRRQYTPEAALRAWDRPLDASFVLDALAGDAAWGPRIDRDRIGAGGYSAGGYTALALAGARYEPARMHGYCGGPDAGPDCALPRSADLARIDFTPAGRDYRDARVRAALALAPALGPGLTEDSLRRITVPVLVVAARDDEILPFRHHAGRVGALIPGAAVEALPEGGHFVFMPQCTHVAWVYTYLKDHDVCGRRHPAVDRAAVHERLGRRVLRFFDEALSAPRSEPPPPRSPARRPAAGP